MASEKGPESLSKDSALKGGVRHQFKQKTPDVAADLVVKVG